MKSFSQLTRKEKLVEVLRWPCVPAAAAGVCTCCGSCADWRVRARSLNFPGRRRLGRITAASSWP